MWVKISLQQTVLDRDKPNTPNGLSTVDLCSAVSCLLYISSLSRSLSTKDYRGGDTFREREMKKGGELESSSQVFSSQLMY